MQHKPWVSIEETLEESHTALEPPSHESEHSQATQQGHKAPMNTKNLVKLEVHKTPFDDR